MPLRVRRWQSRLNTYIDSIKSIPFAPGYHDCAIMTADAVWAMTGKNMADGWRGYTTIEEGLEKLNAAGYEDHTDLAATHFRTVSPSMAQVGDIAVLREGDDQILGIVQGRFVWAVTRKGLGLLPRNRATRAFHVPFSANPPDDGVSMPGG